MPYQSSSRYNNAAGCWNQTAYGFNASNCESDWSQPDISDPNGHILMRAGSEKDSSAFRLSHPK
jgi:hypothetical protein